MPREVDVVERREQRAHFVGRHRIAGAKGAVAGHRRDREIDRAGERALAAVAELVEEVAEEPLRRRVSDEARHRVDRDLGRAGDAHVDPVPRDRLAELLDERGLERRDRNDDREEELLAGDARRVVAAS